MIKTAEQISDMVYSDGNSDSKWVSVEYILKEIKIAHKWKPSHRLSNLIKELEDGN